MLSTASSKLLLDEAPLVIQPRLAVALGVSEALVLQQLHYWLEHNRRVGQGLIDGRTWTYNTLEGWLKDFPFWTASGLRGIFRRLKGLGLIETRSLAADRRDRTLHYTIDYDALELLVSDTSMCHKVTDASSNEVTDAYKEQRLQAETSSETKKSVVVRSSAPEAEREDLLPTSEQRSNAGTRGAYELRLATDVDAQRAFKAAKTSAKALETACLCIDNYPGVWTELVKAQTGRIQRADVFHNLLEDVAEDLKHRSAEQVAGDLKQSFEQAKGSYLGYYRKLLKIPPTERQAERAFFNSSRRPPRIDGAAFARDKKERDRAAWAAHGITI